MSSLPAHPTHVLIDVEAFRSNFRIVRSLVGPDVGIMPIVKANAYGHGVVTLSNAAIEEGAKILGVARSTEAFRLRDEGIRHRTLILEVVPHHHEERCIREECELTIVSEASAGRLNETARVLGKRAKVHVKIDTGMTRLGIPFENALNVVAAVAQMPNLVIEGVFSHFATAEAEDQSFAQLQLERFRSILSSLEASGIHPPLVHMANSGAIITLPDSHFTMVRPGLMLYGYVPRRGMNVEPELKHVLSLQSVVTQLKTVPAGTSVSYGRTYTTMVESRIATIPIGYADGYSRLLSNRGGVVIRGRKYPVAGTVCMDHITVDVGMDAEVQEGDAVVLIGRDNDQEISCWDIAELMGTIPYEVTCLLTSRVPRVTKNSEGT